ncbi:sugar transporter [Histoplasma capsulatum]|uniref:Sugar transporter n=1 Tax=Ajellomyces capsulatus TaxID=5037 RepID=A0A8A1MLA8_AJECA|nr:sugar transporter [Histoplasma capsulatum]
MRDRTSDRLSLVAGALILLTITWVVEGLSLSLLSSVYSPLSALLFHRAGPNYWSRACSWELEWVLKLPRCQFSVPRTLLPLSVVVLLCAGNFGLLLVSF